jgi:hypothetical protein
MRKRLAPGKRLQIECDAKLRIGAATSHDTEHDAVAVASARVFMDVHGWDRDGKLLDLIR